jgi:hypothetical protein
VDRQIQRFGNEVQRVALVGGGGEHSS